MGKCWISERCQAGSCGEQSLVVVAAQPHACPSAGVPGWELWDVGQAPPGLLAAPEVQHSWLSHSHHLPCALLRSPQLSPTAFTVNACISHFPGFRSLFPFQPEGDRAVTASGLLPCGFPHVCSSILFLCCPNPHSQDLGYPKCVPLGRLAWQMGSMRSWPGKLREFWALSPPAVPWCPQ